MVRGRGEGARQCHDIVNHVAELAGEGVCKHRCWSSVDLDPCDKPRKNGFYRRYPDNRNAHCYRVSNDCCGAAWPCFVVAVPNCDQKVDLTKQKVSRLGVSDLPDALELRWIGGASELLFDHAGIIRQL